MASAQERVIGQLKKHFESEEWQRTRTKDSKYAEWLENLTDKDITFGDSPKFIYGKVWGNSTGVGESTYGETTTQRTISIDHLSENICFVDLMNKADKKTLQRAFKNFRLAGGKFYNQDKVYDLAEKEGKRAVKRNLEDLNFSFKSHRLNRYKMQYTSDVITCSLWPIYAKKDDQKKFIGFWEERDGNAKIDLDLYSPMTTKGKIITIGVIAALAIIIALILIL